MTEGVWLGETEPTWVWGCVKSSATERKARLFCVGCARRVCSPLLSPVVEVLLVMVEAVAEGEPMGDEMYTLKAAARETALLPTTEQRHRHAVMAAYYAADRHLLSSLTVSYVLHEAARSTEDANAEYNAQVAILRDIFQNPSRPVIGDPSWLTSTVIALAQGIYKDRAYDNLPILADALQDAGCEDNDILNHLRGPGPHVLGCWAVDLLVRKE